MKKFAMVMVFVLAMTGAVSAQNQWPDLKAYFAAANELKSPAWDFSKNYFWGNDPADSARFSNLTGDLQHIDSYLEFALLTYYSAAEKPWAERGNAILPLNNPRLVDRQLGAAVLQEIQVLRFLDNTAAVGRHEGILKFITDRGNVTRAEVESFYRANIREYIAGIVQTGYDKPRNGFTPSAVYAEWKSRGYGDAIGTLTAVLTEFLSNPTQRGYETLRGIYARQGVLIGDGDRFTGLAASGNLSEIIEAVNPALLARLAEDCRLIADRNAFARLPQPPDDRLQVFSIRYGVRKGD